MLGSLRLTGEAIRTRSRSAIAALGVAVLCNVQPLHAQEEKLDLRVEASIAADDNVTRSTGAGNKLSDTIYAATATKSHFISLAERTRLSLAATFAVEAFHRYSGLSHASIGLQGELQGFEEEVVCQPIDDPRRFGTRGSSAGPFFLPAQIPAYHS